MSKREQANRMTAKSRHFYLASFILDGSSRCHVKKGYILSKLPQAEGQAIKLKKR